MRWTLTYKGYFEVMFWSITSQENGLQNEIAYQGANVSVSIFRNNDFHSTSKKGTNQGGQKRMSSTPYEGSISWGSSLWDN